MGMSRVLQETVSFGSELLCGSVDAILGSNDLGLLHKHALVPALGLLFGRQMCSLAFPDLVLELLNGLHSQLAKLLLVHLQWQVADRETGLGDEERWVASEQGATSREGCLALGQFTGQNGRSCGRVGEDDTLAHEVQITAILTLALVLSSLEQIDGRLLVHCAHDVQDASVESELDGELLGKIRLEDCVLHKVVLLLSVVLRLDGVHNGGHAVSLSHAVVGSALVVVAHESSSTRASGIMIHCHAAVTEFSPMTEPKHTFGFSIRAFEPTSIWLH